MSNQNINTAIQTVQRILYLLALVIVPISVLPFPWDLTEFSMTLSLALFTLPILLLELAKVFVNGTLAYPKNRIDGAILLLFIVLIISTIFSKSPITSMLGFDSRLGGGLIGLITVLAFTYTARNFVKDFDGVIHSILYLLIGVTIGAVISILSFWGMNILEFIPSFKELFTTGLPFYSSARVSLMIFGVATLLSSGLIFYSLKKYNLGTLITGILMFLTNLLAFMLFSIVQGNDQAFLFIAIFASFLVIPFIRRRPLNKSFVGVIGITFLIVFGGIMILKIPQFKELVIRDSSKLITQVTISPEVGWKVATNAVSESFWNGLVGYGVDTFSIAYNLYRPLTDEILVLNNTNFTSPNNHILNMFISMGILGVLAWAYLFFITISHVISDTRKRSFIDTEDFILLLLNLITIYLLVSSVFIYFTIFTYLLLFLSISLAVVIRHMKKEESKEIYVLNLRLFTRQTGETLSFDTNSTIALLFISLPLLWLYSLSLNHLSAGFNVLEAERITSEGRKLNEKGKLGEEDRVKMLVNATNLYGKAIEKVPINDMYHRRASLIITQYVEILVSKYNKSDIDGEKNTLYDDITAYADVAVEEAKLATDRAPQIYANWGARANVYSKIVGIGFRTYSKSALSAMQQAASLNPLNYELYYNAAQLYVVNNDNDSAIRTLVQVFTINPEHIPSNILAGELSLNDKDYRQADRYFDKAKSIMDKYGDIDSELYKYVVKRLTEIGPLLPETETKTEEEDDNTTNINQEDSIIESDSN